MGYQSVTVQIKPSFLERQRGRSRYRSSLPRVGRTEAVAGSVALVVPPGWEASPSERLYRLAPGAHLALDAEVSGAVGSRGRSLFRRGLGSRMTPASRTKTSSRSTIGRRVGARLGKGQHQSGRRGQFGHTLAGALVGGRAGFAGPPASSRPNRCPTAGATHEPGARNSASRWWSGGCVRRAGRAREAKVRLSRIPPPAKGSGARRRYSVHSKRGSADRRQPTKGFAVEPGGETVVAFDVAPASGTSWPARPGRS